MALSEATYQRKITVFADGEKSVVETSILLTCLGGRFRNQVVVCAVEQTVEEAHKTWEKAFEPDNGYRLDCWKKVNGVWKWFHDMYEVENSE